MSGWSIPLEQLAAKVQLDLETVARKSTLDVFTAVVKGAPVDTGRLRANMNVSFGAPNTLVTASRDASRADRELEKVETLPVGGITYITNALPYAAVVEYGQYPNPPKMGSKKRGEAGVAVHVRNGYSMQAPQGMFRIAALRYNDYVKRALGQV